MSASELSDPITICPNEGELLPAKVSVGSPGTMSSIFSICDTVSVIPFLLFHMRAI